VARWLDASRPLALTSVCWADWKDQATGLKLRGTQQSAIDDSLTLPETVFARASRENQVKQARAPVKGYDEGSYSLQIIYDPTTHVTVSRTRSFYEPGESVTVERISSAPPASLIHRQELSKITTRSGISIGSTEAVVQTRLGFPKFESRSAKCRIASITYEARTINLQMYEHPVHTHQLTFLISDHKVISISDTYAW
jgi:hypothetical protein